MYKIGVIGGGAAGISFVYNFLKNKLFNNCNKIISIKVFDKNGFNGGMAYSSFFENHILNMTPDHMSADIFDKAHFVDWILVYFPRYYRVSYPPRWLYRKYLNSIQEMSIFMAIDSNVTLNFISDTVNQIDLHPAGYSVTTACGVAEEMNLVVLCTGHNKPETFYPVDGIVPYQPNMDLSVINSILPIGVIGCSLTAIDAIIELLERIGADNIYAMSRSGLFPGVQPAVIRMPPTEFTLTVKNFVINNSCIDVHHFVHVINEALDQYYSGPERLTNSSTMPVEWNCYQNLVESVNRANCAYQHICNFFMEIHPTVCEAWTKMNESNRLLFMQSYNSSWIRNRHAMPLKNANKIIKALDSQRLHVFKDLLNIKKENTYFTAFCKKFVIHSYYMINCTGPSYKLKKNKLNDNLLQEGIIQENIFGGIKCNPLTLKVYDQWNNEQNLYSLGAPAKGDVFYTSAIEAINRDVKKILYNNDIFNVKK